MRIKSLEIQPLLTDAKNVLVGKYGPAERLQLENSPYDRNLYIATTTRGDYTRFAAPSASFDANLAQFNALMEAVVLDVSLTRPARTIRARATDLAYPFLNPQTFAPLEKADASERCLRPFSETRRINWCLGTSFDGRPAYVPEDLVYRGEPRNFIYLTNESGISAHPDPLKAVENAVVSRIKADACMRTWYKRLSPYPIDPNILSEQIRERITYWRTAGHELGISQLDNDYGEVYLATIRGDNFPAFACGVGATISGNTDQAIVNAVASAEANFGLFASYNENSSMRPVTELRTALDNGLYYASSVNTISLDFLFGRQELTKPYPRAPWNFFELIKKLHLTVCWLTPAHASYHVVRVFSPDLVPLSYGYALGHSGHIALTRHASPVIGEQHRTPHCFFRP